MPNWNLIRLREKSHADCGASWLNRIAEISQKPKIKTESIEDFLKRGGRITKLSPKK